jgi:hypothetical protein
LDFDCETLAAGFADPEWVPNRITAIAWSWVGEDAVETRTILDYARNLPTFLSMNFLGCKPMLEEFVEALEQGKKLELEGDVKQFVGDIIRKELTLEIVGAAQVE